MGLGFIGLCGDIFGRTAARERRPTTIMDGQKGFPLVGPSTGTETVVAAPLAAEPAAETAALQYGRFYVPAVEGYFRLLTGGPEFDSEIAGFAGEEAAVVIVIVRGEDA